MNRGIAQVRSLCFKFMRTLNCEQTNSEQYSPYALIFSAVQNSSNAFVKSAAIASASRFSILNRGMKCTSSPSLNNATDGDDGGICPNRSLARAVASMSWPAKTLVSTSGLLGCCSAFVIAGRALPAAHPQTELTTTSSVPFFWFITSSTSTAFRNSRIPILVSSSRNGWIATGSYIGTPIKNFELGIRN